MARNTKYVKQAAVEFPREGLGDPVGLVVECSHCGETHVINGVARGVRRMPCGMGVNIVGIVKRKGVSSDGKRPEA